jgi:hypothetical protein
VDPYLADSHRGVLVISRGGESDERRRRSVAPRPLAPDDRYILERAVHAVAEQAKNASTIVDEAHAAGLDGSHPVTLQAKMLRLELLKVKADLERQLGRLVLHSTACGLDVHWVAGLAATPGHWAHREPALHGAPVL